MGNKQRKQEVEAWGLTYERYAIANRLKWLSNKYAIKTVAEIPAHGEKAMPSLYSLGFGLNGCEVTLINGNEEYATEWERLSLRDKVTFIYVDDIHNTRLPSDSFDLVWNFAYMPYSKDPDAMISEMKRISRKYIAIFSVNDGNIGFPIHRIVHKFAKIPWTHGDISYNNRRKVARVLETNGLTVKRLGWVNCPFWPDSLGFRDVRLHRMVQEYGKQDIQWISPHVEHMKTGRIPWWIRLVHIMDVFPMPPFIKTLYAHVFYVFGEKKN